jgi:IrrE N-terminal-like domain
MASSRTILESIVIRLRAKLKMTDVEYIDLKAVLEMMVVLFPGFSCRRVADRALHGANGMYNSDTDTIEIPNNVFLGMENRVPHFRFSVAHEIAHAVLKHEGVKFRTQKGRLTRRQTQVFGVMKGRRSNLPLYSLPRLTWPKSARPSKKFSANLGSVPMLLKFAR